MKTSLATTQKLVILGLLAAISIVLVYFIHFPLIPMATFLEYDPADIPIIFGTLLYGPGAGLLLTLVVSVIQGLTVSAQSGIIGIVMHFVATGCFVLVCGLLYKKMRSTKGLILSLAVSVVVWLVVMIVMNLILTPLFMGQPMQTVIEMLLPAIIPFNLLKAGINAVLAFLLYISMQKWAVNSRKEA